MKYFLASLLTFILIHTFAQVKLDGTVENYDGPDSPIVFIDFISGEVLTLGKMTSDGMFEINLEKNFLEKASEMTEEKEQAMEKGWEMKEKTVASTFLCDFDSLNYTNAETVIGGLPRYFIVAEPEKEVEHGVLVAASSFEFLDYLESYGQKDAVKGYYLHWMYAMEDASAEGSCKIATYTGNGEEKYESQTSFDVDLNKGWNLLIYEVKELFEDKNGKKHASVIERKTLSDMPKNAQWIFISEN